MTRSHSERQGRTTFVGEMRVHLAALIMVVWAFFPYAVAAQDGYAALRGPGQETTYVPPGERFQSGGMGSSGSSGPPRSGGNYNRAAAVAYSDRWAHGRNPSYPNYIDNDCTNFISQSMYAGGLPIIIGDGDKTSNRNWYYTGLTGPSYTWGAANNLNEHFSQYQISRYYPTSDISQLTGGDVMLMWIPGVRTIQHGRFIVGNGYSGADSMSYPAGVYGLLANQHSDNKYHVIWDDNVPNGTAIWLWQIVY